MKKLFNFLWGSIEVVNSADGPSQMAIYDTIGKDDFSGGGITGADFSQALNSANNMQDLHIHVNSKGGDVHHGMSMRNALKAWKNKTGRKVTTIIDGIAASTASWAFPTASDEVKAYKGSQVFVHEAMALAAGSAENFRDTADILDKTSMQIADMYAEKSGKPASMWRNKMKSGSLMTGDEAMGEGLVDSIIDGNATNFGPWVETVKQQLVIQNKVLNENPNHDEKGQFTTGVAEAKQLSSKAYKASAKANKSQKEIDHGDAMRAHEKAGKAWFKLEKQDPSLRAEKGGYESDRSVEHSTYAEEHRMSGNVKEDFNIPEHKNQISSAPTQGEENLDTILTILNHVSEVNTFDLISSAVKTKRLIRLPIRKIQRNIFTAKPNSHIHRSIFQTSFYHLAP